MRASREPTMHHGLDSETAMLVRTGRTRQVPRCVLGICANQAFKADDGASCRCSPVAGYIGPEIRAPCRASVQMRSSNATQGDRQPYRHRLRHVSARAAMVHWHLASDHSLMVSRRSSELMGPVEFLRLRVRNERSWYHRFVVI